MAPADPVDRAHLTGMSRPSPEIRRYPPSAALADLVVRYWVPVWSVAEPQRQTTLPYPVCLFVVSTTYARFYGVASGRSTVTLEGDGWAVGTMFTPAAGRLLLGGSVATLTDRYVDAGEIPALGGALAGEVRAAMATDPGSPASHRAAIAAVEQRLREGLGAVDEEGLLVNDILAWLERRPEVTRVDVLADAFGLTPRSLQRLVERRVGLSPKWLIQRRRLHDAIGRIKGGDVELASLAVDLGYADQAHFTRDFRKVTGVTPGQYLADQPRH